MSSDVKPSGEVHPVIAIFPDLPPDELQSLADSIAGVGLLFPITLDENGPLLDGRQRLRACELAGVEPRFEVLPADRDPVTFIMSMNVVREHFPGPARRDMMKVLAAQLAYQSFDDMTDAELAKGLYLTQERVAQCRLIMTYASESVYAIVRGFESVNRALDVVKTRLETGRRDEERLAILRNEANFLVDEVAEDRISLDQAWAAFLGLTGMPDPTIAPEPAPEPQPKRASRRKR